MTYGCEMKYAMDILADYNGGSGDDELTTTTSRMTMIMMMTAFHPQVFQHTTVL